MPGTIVALATPVGRSGIGVIRLSGPDSLSITRKISGDGDITPRLVHLKQLHDIQSSDVIDEALVTYFRAPNSFTGEDVVEISCHGSPVLLRQVIDICLGLGARMAEPGEFTLRALANGRLDLAEAEAIRDLIDAQTTAVARQAVRQMRGEFSHLLTPIKDELLDVIVVLESALEFVEDDLPQMQADSIAARMNAVKDKIETLAQTFRAGKLIREGLRVALVGKPNVGKSSLFNALLGTDRAIVTEIAGTTRDQLYEKFTIDEIPISLIDTAGLRETSDTVESIGVERSRRTMADADLVIVLLDASEQLTDEDHAILESVKGLNFMIALNKTDKPLHHTIDKSHPAFDGSLKISARTGAGLEQLKRAMVDPFEPEDMNRTSFLVTDARHHDLLARAAAEIESSSALLRRKTSEEIVLIGLHNALRYLGSITGETTTEDMLTRIFATFCIGK